jgi:hypothetical protein
VRGDRDRLLDMSEMCELLLTHASDAHAQTMPDGPVEASKPCRSSIPQREEGLVTKPLPVEVAIDTLDGRKRSTLHIGHVSVEVIAMNHRSPDVTSDDVRQRRLPSTAATIERHHKHAVLALHLPSAQGLENTLNRVHEPLRMPDDDVAVHRPDRQLGAVSWRRGVGELVGGKGRGVRLRLAG